MQCLAENLDHKGFLTATQKEGQDISLASNVTEEEVVERTAEVRELHKKVMVK